MKTSIVKKNSQGGYFEKGKAFSRAKWSEVIDFYQKEVDSAGKCSPRRLSQITGIGRKSADEATYFCEIKNFLCNLIFFSSQLL